MLLQQMLCLLLLQQQQQLTMSKHSSLYYYERPQECPADHLLSAVRVEPQQVSNGVAP
jgi:hypothetical protein